MATVSSAGTEEVPTGSGKPATSVDRGLRLLSLLAREGRTLGLAELASRVGLPKASAHRLCAQLVEAGFLARGLDERSYSIGAAMRALAFDTLTNGVERAARHAVLDALVREVGETCNFTALDGAQVLYLDRVEAHWPLRLALDVGTHVPLHCTASGKLFLAQMRRAQRDALIANLALTPLTPNTLTRAEALRAECDGIAARGYSTDREEFIAGLVAIAVPVRDRRGEARAAIAVHAPTARMSLDDAIARLPALRAAAERMGPLL